MPKALKRTLQVFGIILALIVVVLGGYIAYLELTYNRIADDAPIEVENNPSATLQTQTPYSAVTYNIGFGAYTPNYTYFLDKGI